MAATQAEKPNDKEAAGASEGEVQQYSQSGASPLSRLRNRVNGLFGHRLSQLSTFRNDPFLIADQLLSDVQDEFRAFRAGGDALWHPSVDVKETDDHILFHCDVPGTRKEDLSIDLQGGYLLISGKREKKSEDKAEGWQYSERSFGSFSRRFPVPLGTKQADISAKYRDGVLEVTVKKHPPAKGEHSKIQIE